MRHQEGALCHLRCVLLTWSLTLPSETRLTTSHIFELTVSLGRNLEERHMDKTNKYADFITDISHIATSITAFEVSSTGNVTSENKKRLKSLHKYCKPGTKQSIFLKNISCLSIYSSYHIWLCRNDQEFLNPGYLPAPFQSNTGAWPALSLVLDGLSIVSQIFGWFIVETLFLNLH